VAEAAENALAEVYCSWRSSAARTGEISMRIRRPLFGGSAGIWRSLFRDTVQKYDH